jgi:small-conductance mechanosensitive channel
MSALLNSLPPLTRELLVAVAVLAADAAIALVVQAIVFRLLHRFAAKSDGTLHLVVSRAQGPSRFIFPLVGVESALPLVTLPENGKLAAEHVLGILIITAIAWVLVALTQLAGDLTKRRYSADVEDNLHARQIRTRVDILTRTAVTIVIIVAVAIALTTFPAVRAIGATLLASAGLIGIVAGFAARPIFENLVAGVQIALTQPIRIDDVVIVENEFGHVEKIAATYVVVRLWDLRRMILPLTYFINTPFQNWTYTTANLIGSVMLYVDHGVDVDTLRARTGEIIKQSPLWDGAVVNVAVTDAKENTIEIRVLCSAKNAAALFDLRCFLREKLLAHLSNIDEGNFTSTRIVVAKDGGDQSTGTTPNVGAAQPAGLSTGPSAATAVTEAQSAAGSQSRNGER